MSVSAIIVTRPGREHDLQPIYESLPADWEILVWRNGERLERVWADPPGAFAVVREPVPDLAVYGRYAAIEDAAYSVVYTQDDDCVIPAAAIVAHYEATGNEGVMANMPWSRWADYPDSSLVGWGAAFQRDLPALAFRRWWQHSLDETIGGVIAPPWNWPSAQIPNPWPNDPFFQRECDAVFTTLTPHTKIDFGFEHLPWAEGPGRMFTDDPVGHREERQRMVALARRVRDGV